MPARRTGSPTSTIGAGVGVDTRSLKAFQKALRRASPVAAVRLRTEMRAAGEIVAAEARSIVEGSSKSIPPTIKVQVRGAAVAVKAGGPGVPLAGLYELGGKGGQPGHWRHPVFGNRNAWVDQTGTPYLRQAADHKATELEAAVLKVADGVARILTLE